MTLSKEQSSKLLKDKLKRELSILAIERKLRGGDFKDFNDGLELIYKNEKDNHVKEIQEFNDKVARMISTAQMSYHEFTTTFLEILRVFELFVRTQRGGGLIPILNKINPIIDGLIEKYLGIAPLSEAWYKMAHIFTWLKYRALINTKNNYESGLSTDLYSNELPVTLCPKIDAEGKVSFDIHMGDKLEKFSYGDKDKMILAIKYFLAEKHSPYKLVTDKNRLTYGRLVKNVPSKDGVLEFVAKEKSALDIAKIEVTDNNSPYSRARVVGLKRVENSNNPVRYELTYQAQTKNGIVESGKKVEVTQNEIRNDINNDGSYGCPIGETGLTLKLPQEFITKQNELDLIVDRGEFIDYCKRQVGGMDVTDPNLIDVKDKIKFTKQLPPEPKPESNQEPSSSPRP